MWRQGHGHSLPSPELRGLQGVLAENHPAEHGQQIHLQALDRSLSSHPGDQRSLSEMSLPGLCQGGHGGGPRHGRQGEAEPAEVGRPEQGEEEAGEGADQRAGQGGAGREAGGDVAHHVRPVPPPHHQPGAGHGGSGRRHLCGDPAVPADGSEGGEGRGGGGSH